MEKGKGVARRWAVEFTDNSSYSSPADIPDPLGFARSSSDSDDANASRQKKDAEAAWKAQKAWEVAQAPFKNLLMMGFMMWMAGSTVHLFSIGITFSALWQPISALQGVGKVFEPYKDPRVDTLAPKLLFIALNLAAMALGVWKVKSDNLQLCSQCKLLQGTFKMSSDSVTAVLIGSSPYTRVGLGFFTTYCYGS